MKIKEGLESTSIQRLERTRWIGEVGWGWEYIEPIDQHTTDMYEMQARKGGSVFLLESDAYTYVHSEIMT